MIYFLLFSYFHHILLSKTCQYFFYFSFLLTKVFSDGRLNVQ